MMAAGKVGAMMHMTPLLPKLLPVREIEAYVLVAFEMPMYKCGVWAKLKSGPGKKNLNLKKLVGSCHSDEPT
jgi:hypothetical protein